MSRSERVNLSSRELAAVQNLNATLLGSADADKVDAAPTRLPSVADTTVAAPPSPNGRRGTSKTKLRKMQAEKGHTAAVQLEHRRCESTKQALAVSASEAKLAFIANSPVRLRARRLREAKETDHSAQRRAGFNLSVHVHRARDESASFTPRHVKARYLGDLAEADRISHVPAAWWQAERRRRGLGVSDGRDLPPLDAASGDVAALSDELQRRSAVKAARRGLPPPEGFTQLSEAISAVVVADKGGRARLEGQLPPTPLCGDTMTYWDRVNFYNRFQESCAGGNEKDLRATIPRNRASRR